MILKAHGVSPQYLTSSSSSSSSGRSHFTAACHYLSLSEIRIGAGLSDITQYASSHPCQCLKIHRNKKIKRPNIHKEMKSEWDRKTVQTYLFISCSFETKTRSKCGDGWCGSLSVCHSHLSLFHCPVCLSLLSLFSPRRHNAPVGCQSESSGTGKCEVGERNGERRGGERGNHVARRVFRSLLDKRMC